MPQQMMKDPAAVLDYAWDWSDWLEAGETIAAHTVTAPAGLVLGASAAVAGVVTAWLAGGVADASYSVVCQIVTSLARTDERTILIQVRER